MNLWHLFSRSITVLAAPVLVYGQTVVVKDTPRPSAVEMRDTIHTFTRFTASPVYYYEPEARDAHGDQWGTARRIGTDSVGAVVLENDYVRVVVSPELSGSVLSAYDKPAKRDIFFTHNAFYDLYPFIESGTTVSFPYHEIGVHIGEQPASYRIVQANDGSVTVAMWMEFSRHNRIYERKAKGRHSGMILSQFVTLSPGRRDFSLAYRLTNTTPYRQGMRLWANARFPRHDLPAGPVMGFTYYPDSMQAEPVMPTALVSDHRGNRERKYEAHNQPLSAGADGRHCSLFAWALRYPFCGVWYPRSDVNRLRLSDHRTAPGAKYYYQQDNPPGRPILDWEPTANMVELWGGSSTIFEGVEQWIEPGRTYIMEHRYFLTEGAGKALWADSLLCIGTAVADDSVTLIVSSLERITDVDVGIANRKFPRTAVIEPGMNAHYVLPGSGIQGKVHVTVSGRTVLNQRFPLDYTADSVRCKQIRNSVKWGGRRAEMMGLPADRGENCRDAIGMMRSDSLAMARLLYRDGYIRPAIRLLRTIAVSDNENGALWYLLGVCSLELGNTVAARTALNKAMNCMNPYIHAVYYLAALELAQGEWEDAVKLLELDTLKGKQSWDGRLLTAWALSKYDTERAWALTEEMEKEDPADPRLAFIRYQAAHAGCAPRKLAELENVLEALAVEPGAQRRIDEFCALTEGKLLHPFRVR